MAKRKKRPVGCPTTYRPEFCDYFINATWEEHYTDKEIVTTYKDGTTMEKTERVPEPPIFLSTIAYKIAVAIHPKDKKKQRSFISNYRNNFRDWAKKYPDFGNAIKEFKEYEVERIRVNGSLSLYSAAFSIFTLKNIAGWRDTQEVKHSGGIEVALADRIKEARMRANG